MNFTAYIEQKKKKSRLENMVQVRKNINSPKVKEKISNHIERWNGIFSYEDVKEAILTNDLVASFFAVNPDKQNICENEAIMILGSKAKKMPSTGENCIRFDITGEKVNKKSPTTSESVDCIYLGEYYATLKYTKEEGGSQNNQYEKVNTFLRYGSIKHKVAAIVDGPYWDRHRDILKAEYANNPNVIITSVTEITESN